MTQGGVRAIDPATSEDAAATVDVNRYGAVALAAVKACPTGLSIDEIADGTGVDRQTMSPRMIELEKRGLVSRLPVGMTKSGRPKYASRPGKSGKKQQIWYAAGDALDYAAR